jgi:sialate O-acetylesterase
MMASNKVWRLMAASVAFVLVVGALTAARADPSLPTIISNHAVFQQGRKIHLWGAADPGEKIIVSLSLSRAQALADSSGHWSIDLPPMQAGGPFRLKVAGNTTLVVEDVLIGEVWVASGQSNMTFALSDSATAAEDLPRADYNEIRLFTVPKRLTVSPQSDTLSATWAPCTPGSAKEFSAVAYYFARKLHHDLHVPVGIIESAWPGTAIEEWMAPEAVQLDPAIKPILDDRNAHEGSGFAQGRQPFDLQFDDFELLPPSASDPMPVVLSNFDDGTARNSLGGYWSYDAQPAPDTAFELTSPGYLDKGFAAQVSGRIDASDDSRLLTRFHQDLSPADLSAYAGVRFWVRGDGTFRFRLLQPTIGDWDDYSVALIHASPRWTPVTISFRDLRQEGWGVTQEFTPQSLTGIAIECLPDSGYPLRPATSLYGGMIAPLLRYSFRGVIWYQGEGNALRAREYRSLLPAMIQSWRAVSHQPDMPFLIVQLPNHGSIPEQPAESAWAELREAQFLTAKKLHHVGLAITIDVGDPKDLHPHRKAEIGDRLALWALGTTYHQPLTYSGPLYESMSIAASTIRIWFSNLGSGLVAKGGDLQGFAIAGKDRKFHWATASIDGNSVIISSPEVRDPVAVRYAWADSPACNLFDAEGLPASPFRTDDWPGITK